MSSLPHTARKTINCLLLMLLLLPALPTTSASETNASNAVVFMYHRFGEDKYPSTNIRISQFIEQLDFLQREGFTIYPLSKIVKSFDDKIKLPDKVIALSVDDAYLSVYENAFPILKARKIPFTIFISTENVDKKHRNYMSWDQLREMQQQGMEIGNHSSHHLHMIRTNQTEQNWKQSVLDDISHAQRRLKNELGVDTKLFAYPYGEFSEELADLISGLGMIGFGQQSGAIGPSSDNRYYPRYPISEHYADLAQFKDKAYSLALPLTSIQPREPIWLDPSPPQLHLQLDPSTPNANRLQCFASGIGAIETAAMRENEILIKSTKPFHTRRFRYNCTLPSSEAGRFYWYSHLWINPTYPED